MDAARAKKWMQLFNEKIQSQKDYLSDLDTPIGDGDHGANMARGMVAAVESLAAKDFTSAAEVPRGDSPMTHSWPGSATSFPAGCVKRPVVSSGARLPPPIPPPLTCGCNSFLKKNCPAGWFTTPRQ